MHTCNDEAISERPCTARDLWQSQTMADRMYLGQGKSGPHPGQPETFPAAEEGTPPSGRGQITSLPETRR